MGTGVQSGALSRYVKEVGLKRTLRKVLGEVAYDRRYYKTLSEATGLSLNERHLDLREMAVTSLAIPSSSVNLIHSNATWEHLEDVARANREVP